MKWTSEVHANPETINHQDSPVPSTANGDVYCCSKCTPTLYDFHLGVSNEVETCIPSPLDFNVITTWGSAVREALSHVELALSHAYTVLYEHSIQHDIKLHPHDKLSLNCPQLSVSSASPKCPFDKVALVQPGSSPPNLCAALYSDKKEAHLS